MNAELMTIERLAPQAGVNWETAKRFVETAARFEHGAVACRVMAGLVLTELKNELGITKGARTDKNLFHGERSWGETVKEKLGISEATAWRWMEMSEAARARLVADDIAGVFRQLLEIPLSQLTDDQAKALSSGVEALVDGRSQLDFMQSLGLLAPPPAKGGGVEWEAFVRAKHPELIVDGKIPSRGKAGKESKTILQEFQAWLEAKAKPRTVKEKQEAARVLLANLIEVMRGAVKNPVLMVLEPTEFVEAAALSKMWSDRVNQLVSRRD